jgi:ankyrin repeat protein
LILIFNKFLSTASRTGYIEVLKELLHHNADIGTKDKKGRTGLDHG